DHVNVVFLDVLFQAGHQFRAFGVGHGNEVLDANSVHYLATKAFGDQRSTDALACGVDGCCGTSRATTDHQHFVGRSFIELGSGALRSTAVYLVDDLSQCHAALSEMFTIQEYGRHGHDLAALDLI